MRSSGRIFINYKQFLFLLHFVLCTVNYIILDLFKQQTFFKLYTAIIYHKFMLLKLSFEFLLESTSYYTLRAPRHLVFLHSSIRTKVNFPEHHINASHTFRRKRNFQFARAETSYKRVTHMGLVLDPASRRRRELRIFLELSLSPSESESSSPFLARLYLFSRSSLSDFSV